MTDGMEKAIEAAAMSLAGGADLYLASGEIKQSEYRNFARAALSAALPLVGVAREDVARAVEWLKSRIDWRLSDYLCGMKPNYDDSITGFNEAWDLVREIFAKDIDFLPKHTGQPQEGWKKKRGPVLDLAGLIAALRAPGAKRQVRAAAAAHIIYQQSLLRDSALSAAPASPRAEGEEVAWCVFCKKEHAGGATCMGHHP